jgi:phospholipid-translocating ATPase
MSDIPLHSLGRKGKTRAGYVPLNDAQDTDMPTSVLRAAATRNVNLTAKGKGKQRERYIDADEFDEEATLLGNRDSTLEEAEEGDVGEQSKRVSYLSICKAPQVLSGDSVHRDSVRQVYIRHRTSPGQYHSDQ